MPLNTLIRQLVCSVLFSAVLLAQTSAKKPVPGQGTPSTPNAAGQQSADELAQIRDDLNKMESLNMNMSTEIEFLHDQNLQILLRTNSRMWMILIRDLRRQLEHEQQQRNTAPAH